MSEIQRYSIDYDGRMPHTHDYGVWVYHKDHLTEVSRQRLEFQTLFTDVLRDTIESLEGNTPNETLEVLYEAMEAIKPQPTDNTVEGD